MEILSAIRQGFALFCRFTVSLIRDDDYPLGSLLIDALGLFLFFLTNVITLNLGMCMSNLGAARKSLCMLKFPDFLEMKILFIEKVFGYFLLELGREKLVI